jgi:hypothetical protein
MIESWTRTHVYIVNETFNAGVSDWELLELLRDRDKRRMRSIPFDRSRNDNKYRIPTVGNSRASILRRSAFSLMVSSKLSVARGLSTDEDVASGFGRSTASSGFSGWSAMVCN